MLDYVIIFPFAYGGKIQNKNIDGKNVMFHFEIDSTDEIDLETNISVLILLRFTNILQKLKEYKSSQPILHRPKRKMRNQSVYDRIDYSLKSCAFQEQNIIIFSDVKAPKRLVST